MRHVVCMHLYYASLGSGRRRVHLCAMCIFMVPNTTNTITVHCVCWSHQASALATSTILLHHDTKPAKNRWKLFMLLRFKCLRSPLHSCYYINQTRPDTTKTNKPTNYSLFGPLIAWKKMEERKWQFCTLQVGKLLRCGASIDLTECLRINSEPNGLHQRFWECLKIVNSLWKLAKFLTQIIQRQDIASVGAMRVSKVATLSQRQDFFRGLILHVCAPQFNLPTWIVFVEDACNPNGPRIPTEYIAFASGPCLVARLSRPIIQQRPKKVVSSAHSTFECWIEWELHRSRIALHVSAGGIVWHWAGTRRSDRSLLHTSRTHTSSLTWHKIDDEALL